MRLERSLLPAMAVATPLLALSAWTIGSAHAQTTLPQEVSRYLRERALCEHFLNEPVEGRTAEQQARRAFVADSVDLYCAGTDKRLAALKRRYASDRRVMKVLAPLEGNLE